MEMNRELIVLINARLVGTDPQYHRQIVSHELRENAVWIGAQLHGKDGTATIRTVAALLHVSPSTVSRWFQPGEFERECEYLSHAFKADGYLKPSIPGRGSGTGNDGQ